MAHKENTVIPMIGSPLLHHNHLHHNHASGLRANNPVLSWNDPGNEYNGEVRFYVKPGSRTRRLTGKLWKPSGPKPETANLSGLEDSSYLISWSGTYYTNLAKADGDFAPGGPLLEVIGKGNQPDSLIFINGYEVILLN